MASRARRLQHRMRGRMTFMRQVAQLRLAVHDHPLVLCIEREQPGWREQLIETTNTGLVSMSFKEALNLSRLVTKTAHLEGDIAELGTFHGGSALVMAQANAARKRMHLFDTFEGIPYVSETLDSVVVGDIRGKSLEEVQAVLADYADCISYHVGIFPATTSGIDPDQTFCLVNLDADTYEGTLEALRFFYPRMTPGGAILVHDYSQPHTVGVKVAVDEYFADKPEPVIELWDSQALVIKA